MIRIIKEILFVSVLSIILLHSFIPHSDELIEKNHFELHQNSTSIFGFLRLVFHESDDENLDNLIFDVYQIEEKVSINFHQPIISTNSGEIIHGIVLTTNSFKLVNFNINNEYFIVKPNGARGSPFPINHF